VQAAQINHMKDTVREAKAAVGVAVDGATKAATAQAAAGWARQKLLKASFNMFQTLVS
jgi:hypothetical protein